jgi:archaeal flagellar protein FlaF
VAGAEIIGAAIGVLLLVLVGYIMVGSTLSSAEIVANAQKDITLQNEARLRTDMSFFPSSAQIINTISSPNLTFCLNNTGSEVIGDFTHMDVFTTNVSGTQHYIYDSTGGAGYWTIFQFDRDFVHPRMLDPGEAVWINATYVGEKPTTVLVSTSNGVYTSSPIP